MRAIIAALLLSGCADPRSSKFNVGDCVTAPWPREKWESPWTVYKIDEIGESRYRVNGGDSLSFSLSSDYKKVTCPRSGAEGK